MHGTVMPFGTVPAARRRLPLRALSELLRTTLNYAELHRRTELNYKQSYSELFTPVRIAFEIGPGKKMEGQRR